MPIASASWFSSLGSNHKSTSAQHSTFVADLIGNLVIGRIGAANWLTLIVLSSGVVAVGMSFSPTWQALAVCRLLLGLCQVRNFFR